MASSVVPRATRPPTTTASSASSHRCWPAAVFAASLIVALAYLLAGARQSEVSGADPPSLAGRSSSGGSGGSSGTEYRRTDEQLAWQRTAFHFQPEKNWMNDPNGPMLYKGWYHIFYQYNPDSPLFGNITWGHATSRDLINWFHLPPAMVRDHWYDANGVFSGSATLLPDGDVIMLYTGHVNDLGQVQNLARPTDPSDPWLIEWVKTDTNPILLPPPGSETHNFRDPSTAWYVESDSSWRFAIGTKDSDHVGKSLVYRTKDFATYELVPGAMHAVPGTGMWECIDFYPVSTAGSTAGLDTSANGADVKHVLKVSRYDDTRDYYAIGSYDVGDDSWTPDDPEADVGVGLRVDYGKYFASKTFYDKEKRRRVSWGWIGESDDKRNVLRKGWASIQSIPRTVRFDEKTRANLLQWPVEEVESLRLRGREFSSIDLSAGSVVPLDVGKTATQLDILAVFDVSREALEELTLEEDDFDAVYSCNSSTGSAGRGALGPFGLLVLADGDRTEQTSVYFFFARGRRADGKLVTFVCTDELRSSRADDVVKSVQGGVVPVLDGEMLSLRILVDHSVVEAFAQGGRTSVTSRVYPTRAIYDSARLFLFNNSTRTRVTAASVQVWEMKPAEFLPFSHLNRTTTKNTFV